MSERTDKLLLECPLLGGAELEVLRQCRMTVWDGNVVSKQARSSLADKGLIVRYEGWQVITREGLKVLDALGELRDDRWPRPKWQPASRGAERR
jgi:hypothetical protein